MQILQMPNILVNHGFVVQADAIFEANNRVIIANAINKDIVLLKQKHTNNIVEINQNNVNNLKDCYVSNNNLIIGDGLITQLPNIALACLVADCACVFLFAKNINTVAILHSGWQGTLLGINENMILKLQQMGADLSQLNVAIAPSIQQESYQVGDEFYEKFITQNIKAKNFFIKIDNKWHYNNSSYIATKYQNAGVKNIFISNQDTYTNDIFFSHRYFTHFNKKNGRMLGFIYL